MNYLFICILSMIIVSSCKTSPPNTDHLQKFALLQHAKINSQIYVIPGAGCPGCISGAELIAMEKKNNDSFYFVFTRITSNKLFRLKLPELLTATNVIIDSQNIFKSPEAKFDIYPAIFIKKEDGFVLQQYLKPD